MTAPAALPTAAALFERSADRHRDLVAVEDARGHLTYGELDRRANRLARRLVALGIGADRLVAVALPRSIDCIVAFLAVLKAGAAYLPLDVSYPPQRVAFMLRDAEPALVVTDPAGRRRLAAAVDGLRFLSPEPATGRTPDPAPDESRRLTDAERQTPASADHAMYVIYTSGSTGTPKGVVVTGTGMAALADTQSYALRVGPGDRVLQWASISFDAAFWDISAALFAGATLVLAPGDRAVPDAELHDLLRTGRITHATLPPAVLASLDDTVLAGATIVSTGDRCTEALARQWCRGRRLLNGYGPTETTVGATISTPYDGSGPVPIGRPFTDTVVELLDDRLRPVAAGEVGEIYVGGPGLARGYLGRPALTATRFVADPFRPGQRLYRTGDLASVLDDGQLVFRGRADDQVKIRGFRVEPGEVESVLAAHPQVTQAAVVVRDDDHLGRHLVAYVVAPGCPTERLRDHLAERLPDYLVPATILAVPAMALTPNGKIDRAGLPIPVRPRRQAGAVPAAPTAEERYLLDTVSRLLGVASVHREDDFFDLGGHSLLAARLIGTIRKDLGIRLPVRTLYQGSRISQIAAHLAADGKLATDGKLAAAQSNETGSEL